MFFKEDALKQRKVDYDNILSDLQLAQKLNNKSKEETEELFLAIQEVAMNLDQKKAECTQITIENEQMQVFFY